MQNIDDFHDNNIDIKSSSSEEISENAGREKNCGIDVG